MGDGGGHRVESDVGVPELVDEVYDQADVGVGVGDLGPAFGDLVDEFVDGAGGALSDEGSFDGAEVGRSPSGSRGLFPEHGEGVVDTVETPLEVEAVTHLQGQR